MERIVLNQDLPKPFAKLCGSNISKIPIIIFFSTLDDFVMKILIFCAFINLFINLIFEEDKLLGSIDGVAILVAVVICTLVAAVNDFQKEK